MESRKVREKSRLAAEAESEEASPETDHRAEGNSEQDKEAGPSDLASTGVAYSGDSEEKELTPEERVELEQLLEKDDAQEIVMQRSMFSGPLPPPSILQGYSDVLDGGAERIMRLTEREQEHRHYMEKAAVTGHIRLDRRGQYLGFGIAVIALLSATYLISTGNVISGTIIGTVDLVGLVGAFIYGRHVKANESKSQEDED